MQHPHQPRKPSPTARFLLKLTVMAALLAFLYRKVDFTAFQNALRGFHWLSLLPIYGMLFFNTILNSWKWQMLLRADHVPLPLPSLIASHLTGTFFNLFLPSSIGGDAYRILDVGRRAGGGARSFASVFSERLLGFLALAIWSLLFTTIGAKTLPHQLLLLPIAVFLIMTTIMAAVFQRRALEASLRFLHFPHFKSLWTFVRRVLDSVSVYRGNPRLLLRVFLLSLLFQMVSISTIFLMSRALHWTIPFVYFCIFIPLITLGEAIPISIFGIGVRDSLYAFFFMQANATREQALSLALVYLLITLLYSLAGGLVFLLRTPPPPTPTQPAPPSLPSDTTPTP